jgi:hypothetical protein
MLFITLSQVATFQSNPNQFNVIACSMAQHNQQMAKTNRNCVVLNGDVAKTLN